MTAMLSNFRECARMWFADELSGIEARRFVNDAYGYLRWLDLYTDEHPDNIAALFEYLDISRVWNSVAIENKRLAAEARDRIGPIHRPDCSSVGAWSSTGGKALLLGCCQCDHETVLQFRVRGPDGKLIDGCTVEFRTSSGRQSQ